MTDGVVVVSQLPTPRWLAISASTTTRGQRRLDAESFLSKGFNIRERFLLRSDATTLGTAAQIWQPNRLKGIQVSEEYGTPFLSAGQVFEYRPRARKWLAAERTPQANSRLVKHGTILVSCSGSVGRAIISHTPHEGVLITHDLLRVEPHRPEDKGWLYAYLKTQTAVQLAVTQHYGDMIKHLADHHLQSVPFFEAPTTVRRRLNVMLAEVLRLRDLAFADLRAAEELLTNRLATKETRPPVDAPRRVRASELSTGRRRLDAYSMNPVVAHIERSLKSAALTVETLGEVTKGVFWPPRFTRVMGGLGELYLSAESLFDVNRESDKRILVPDTMDATPYRVKKNWILMARSGQIYGLNGSVVMATEAHANAFITEDLIRIVADPERIRAGYLYAFLGHPDLGRPLVIRHCYGTSIPHLEPEDVSGVSIPRFERSLEDEIADLAESATRARGEADSIENSMTVSANELIQQFLGAPAPTI